MNTHVCYRLRHDPATGPVMEVAVRGHCLLGLPLLNKGSAFGEAERDEFGLRGLLPARVATMEEQLERVRENHARVQGDLARYMDLAALMDRNETLFYRLLVDHMEELLPIVYTPTVGQACKEFGHIFRRSRGVYLTPEDRGRLDQLLGAWPTDDVRVIVVTDGQRILGLGDLGAGGMGIPVGKLALYVAAGGLHPAKTLPVTLDVGTDNEALLSDPLYMGLRRKRLAAAEYDDFVEAFVAAAGRRFPGVLVQFEDFATAHAFALLERYRERCLCFNDDIQGTASVVVAGVLAALARTKGRLADQTFVMAGAGESVVGIASLLVFALREEGLAEEAARARFWLVDSQGLVHRGRKIAPHKQRFARDAAEAAGLPAGGGDVLAALVRAVRPTMLVGGSGQPGLFTRAVIEALVAGTPEPVVFALSNPTSKSECTAEQAFAWSGGRVLLATGSPFPPVAWNGVPHRIGQANNAFVFPGIGLGLVACRARRVTDGMFLAAARALAREAPAGRHEALYPPQGEIRRVSRRVAVAVVEEALRSDLCPPPDCLAEELVEREIWEPRYLPYRSL